MTEPKSDVSRTRRILAVLLSVIPGPGNGHLLLGRWPRALCWLAVLSVVQATLVFTRLPGLILSLVLVAVAAVDAARLPPARRIPRPGVAVMLVLGFWVASLVPRSVVRHFVVEPFHMPSGSMEPALLQGDHFMVNHTVGSPWGWREVERGEVVVLVRPEEPELHYIKRVVALGGDTISAENGQLVLNGKPVERSLTGTCDALPFTAQTGTPCEVYEEVLGEHRYRVAHGPYSGDFPRVDVGCPPGMEPKDGGCGVPPGTVFVLGDNRGNSVDSRQWGPVPVSGVQGVADHIHFSWHDGSVRWGRLGQRVE